MTSLPVSTHCSVLKRVRINICSIHVCSLRPPSSFHLTTMELQATIWGNGFGMSEATSFNLYDF